MCSQCQCTIDSCKCYIYPPCSLKNTFTVHDDDIELSAVDMSKRKGVSLAHSNCRSVTKYTDELLNETCLCNNISDAEIAMPEYFFVQSDRNRNGGGVLLAVNSSLYVSQNINGSSSSFGIEAVSVRISLGCNTLFVSSIYVPPSYNVRYYEQVILYMEKILSFGYETIFMGDFNLDFLGNGPGLNRIEHICATLSLDQLVYKATRVTPDTSTCIDLIFTSIKSKHTYIDIIPVTLSDHFLISTTVNLSCFEKGSKSVRTRSYKKFYFG